MGSRVTEPVSRKDMASPDQQAELMRLWARYTGRRDRHGLARWVRQYSSCNDLDLLSRTAASRAIAALRRTVQAVERWDPIRVGSLHGTERQ